MKNILLGCLLCASIFLAGEFFLRHHGIQLPLETTIHYRPEISATGHLLNPNKGIIRSSSQFHIQYHFYPPHLRDTPVNHDAISILVLGDSFTFGWLLPSQKTFIYELQTKVDHAFGKNKYQFLNAATPGWGTTDQLAYLKDYGSELSPQFVLVFLNIEDIGRSIWQDIYKLPDSDSLPLINNARPMKTLLRSVFYNGWIYEHSVLLQFSHDFLHKEYLKYMNVSRTNELIFRDVFVTNYGEGLFRQMNEWCKEHHATLLVVTTGFNAFYPNGLHDPTRTFLTKAPSFFNKEGIRYYDIAPLLKKTRQKENDLIGEDEHPNPLGAHIIAESSWPWLKQQIAASPEHPA